MIDRKAAIARLLQIANREQTWMEEIGLPDASSIGAFLREVAEMLREQEPILLENQHKPYGISTNANSPWVSRCPKCGKKIEGKQTRYCKYCGRAVKWND